MGKHPPKPLNKTKPPLQNPKQTANTPPQQNNPKTSTLLLNRNTNSNKITSNSSNYKLKVAVNLFRGEQGGKIDEKHRNFVAKGVRGISRARRIQCSDEDN